MDLTSVEHFHLELLQPVYGAQNSLRIKKRSNDIVAIRYIYQQEFTSIAHEQIDHHIIT